ncbi:hypothetical protein A2701_01875 [Candidatus Amesbacteria bacterium RIFCSPHIGHO2_01_FULL_47_34]|uniref:Uncharacterized protein n=1 Tax=Candidatus Amesbacteria bacterium RIFCSPLOWO2_01_FULL_47_33 TaxID=1797258 RepID=A0A1F4Z6I0_9BACT|nr:MAG: hypothetical protein A2701_01875 [Candidatus Amesbacteria bacterium RIFCSPHIGHO2_01_FULL_47_34]OGD01803.1 MAG: hypothetical protein A2972_02700 [Candidatus Amesbacteria bacterium RIFCSPLOWO2_01_FULL_47_33]
MDDSDFRKLLAKVEELKKGKSFDLSLEEDLSIAVMNLISLEEHFFFTSQKTGKNSYLDLLAQTREIRKKLLGRMIDSHEGETWCISKHLLAATMRIMEVATKLQTDGKTQESESMFSQAYKVYSLFWALRLKLINTKNVKKTPDPKQWSYEDLVTKLVDCCKE